MRSEWTKMNAEGDHTKSKTILSKTKSTALIQPSKRMKTEQRPLGHMTSGLTITMPDVEDHQQQATDEFFFRSHPFSDLTLLIQGLVRKDSGEITSGGILFRSRIVCWQERTGSGIESISILLPRWACGDDWNSGCLTRWNDWITSLPLPTISMYHSSTECHYLAHSRWESLSRRWPGNYLWITIASIVVSSSPLRISVYCFGLSIIYIALLIEASLRHDSSAQPWINRTRRRHSRVALVDAGYFLYLVPRIRLCRRSSNLWSHSD